MLLIAEVRGGGALRLSAYSFDKKELDALSETLFEAGIKAEYKDSKRFLDPRPGRVYHIQADEAYKWEELLQVRFVGKGKNTKVKLDDFSSGAPHYRCRQVSRLRLGKSCIDLTAKTRTAAIVKCALLAKSKRWYGGVAEPGRCTDPK